MSWIHDILSLSEDSVEQTRQENEERFPMHTYGVGYPIVLRREEIDEFYRLLEIEESAPDSWDDMPFMSREDMEDIIDDVVGTATDNDINGGIPSPEERREELREILELWENQITGDDGVAWTTIGTDYEVKFYITHCEARADADHDKFEEPSEMNTVREVYDRIEMARDSRESAIIHKRSLPLMEPEEQ